MRMLLSPLAGLALLAGSVVAAPAAPAPAAPAGIAGYVWGSQPASPDYVANTGYEYNSAGGDVRIVRHVPGSYHVSFEGMAGKGGVAHASAYGSDHHCTVNTYGARGADEIVHVRCFDTAGNPADTRFVAHVSDHRPATGSYGFVRNDRPVPRAGGYTPPAQWAYDSAGEPVVVHRTAVGQYQLELGSFAQDSAGAWADGSVTVTARASAARHCQVMDPAVVPIPKRLYVNCYDHTGSGVDTGFTLSYAHGVSPLGTVTAHATATVERYGGVPVVAGWSNTTGGGATATDLGVGSYLVTFRGTAATRGHAIGTIMGTPPQYCNIQSWWTDGAHQYLWMRCFQNGAPHPAMLYNVGFIR